ncbi:MAG: hypothetical protein N4A65_00450 [Cohaesibacter sp.]|jgi:hypothetical protein|nr:hypothetical protein [Cohaesibacter sp.]
MDYETFQLVCQILGVMALVAALIIFGKAAWEIKQTWSKGK